MFDVTSVHAVVFDYGNTLVPFGAEQLTAYGTLLAQALEQRYGPLDREKFLALRTRSRYAPYGGNPPAYRENDLAETTIQLIEELYGLTPSEETLAEVLRVRFDSFVAVVDADDETAQVLVRLRRRYRLGLLSNYPDGAAIRASLAKVGLAPYFDSVVVSGDLGYCKPHPVPFAASLQELGLRSQEVVFVGDNWLADVQGAKRVGMPMVQMRQWLPPEEFPPQAGDLRPDAAIYHLSELEPLLLDHA